MLPGDFAKFVLEADEKQDLALICKANAAKRKTDEKNGETQKSEKALGILEQKRKSLRQLYPEYFPNGDAHVYHINTFTLFKTNVNCYLFCF